MSSRSTAATLWKVGAVVLFVLGALFASYSAYQLVNDLWLHTYDGWGHSPASRAMTFGLLGIFALLLGWVCWRREHAVAHDTPVDFLEGDEEERVVNAIRNFELKTSGEIRVHLEYHSDRPPLEQAQRVFAELGMTATRQRNGVLFYVAVHDQRFAVVGDEGIDRVVADTFWADVAKDVEALFRQGDFAEGLRRGIERAGHELVQHFPYQSDVANELPDGISRSSDS